MQRTAQGIQILASQPDNFILRRQVSAKDRVQPKTMFNHWPETLGENCVLYAIT